MSVLNQNHFHLTWHIIIKKIHEKQITAFLCCPAHYREQTIRYKSRKKISTQTQWSCDCSYLQVLLRSSNIHGRPPWIRLQGGKRPRGDIKQRNQSWRKGEHQRRQETKGEDDQSISWPWPKCLSLFEAKQ